jgi:hypothetical protein
MRVEDMQTVAVFLFEGGMSPSEVDRGLKVPDGFTYVAVKTWWRLMDAREHGFATCREEE